MNFGLEFNYIKGEKERKGRQRIKYNDNVNEHM